MNTVLWVLQVALAIKFASVTYTHGLNPKESEMAPGVERLGGLARPLLALVSVLTLNGALGLVLPAVIGRWTVIVPWSAAGLVTLMALGIAFHTGCRGRPKIAAGLVLVILTALVAYGRWVLVPL